MLLQSGNAHGSFHSPHCDDSVLVTEALEAIDGLQSQPHLFDTNHEDTMPHIRPALKQEKELPG